MGAQKQFAIGITHALETRHYEALKEELTSLESRAGAQGALRFLLSTLDMIISEPGMWDSVEFCHTEGCATEVPIRKAHYLGYELYCEDHV